MKKKITMKILLEDEQSSIAGIEHYRAMLARTDEIIATSRRLIEANPDGQDFLTCLARSNLKSYQDERPRVVVLLEAAELDLKEVRKELARRERRKQRDAARPKKPTEDRSPERIQKSLDKLADAVDTYTAFRQSQVKQFPKE